MCSVSMHSRGTGLRRARSSRVPPVRNTFDVKSGASQRCFSVWRSLHGRDGHATAAHRDSASPMRFGALLLGLAALLIFAHSGGAAQEGDDVIAPFVGPDTLVVVRGELNRINENALIDTLVQTVKEPTLDAPQREMLRQWWKNSFHIGNGPMSDFRDAGVTRAYWVLTLQDFLDPSNPAGMWVFPVEGATNTKRVIDASRAHKLNPQQIGDVVVAWQPGRPVTAGAASPLPAAWAHALAAGGDAPARIAIVPTAVLRKSLEENVPSVPTTTGPAPITILTLGIDWISISATLSPAPQVLMVAQAPDASAARAIAGLLERTLPDLRAQNSTIPQMLLDPADLAELLKPTVAGDQVQWKPEFEQVLAPLIARNIRQAVRSHSETNMRQILQGLLMYANNHQGQTPPDLDALIKDNDMVPQVLVDPLNPKEKVGFVYLRPAGDWQTHSDDWAVLYESTPDGHNVGFADGHVGWLATREDVESQVKAAEARNRAAAKGKK